MNSCPREQSANRPPGSRSSTRSRSSTAAAIPPSARSGDAVVVSADIFRDGHEVLRAVVRWRGPGETDWHEAPMRHIDARQPACAGRAPSPSTEPGRWTFTIEAWTDAFASWREELDRKVAAGQSTTCPASCRRACCCSSASPALAEGERPRDARARAQRRRATPTAPTSARARGGARARPARRRAALARPAGVDDPAAARSSSTSTASGPASAPGTSCSRAPGAASRASAASCPAWPSSASTSSTCRRSTRSAVTNRKGANNALVAAAGDPGSPWAIGDASRRPRRDPPGPRHAATTSTRSSPRGAASASRSASTSRSSARPTTRGSPSTPSGSTAGRTGR